jgi:hypothetical protein
MYAQAQREYGCRSIGRLNNATPVAGQNAIQRCIHRRLKARLNFQILAINLNEPQQKITGKYNKPGNNRTDSNRTGQ